MPRIFPTMLSSKHCWPQQIVLAVAVRQKTSPLHLAPRDQIGAATRHRPKATPELYFARTECIVRRTARAYDAGECQIALLGFETWLRLSSWSHRCPGPVAGG